MAGPFRHSNPNGTAFRKVVVWLSGLITDIGTSPTITSGSAAPSASEPKGSVYLRTGGASGSEVVYVATDAAGTWYPLTGA